jgi:TetR/AcrR family transcriptional regulator
MTASVPASPSPWADRVVDRSENLQRSRARQIEQAKAIVAAARRLIAERGDQFTTQELVKEARVALQTFYRVFGGKDQLLLAVFEDLISESCAEYEEQARDLPDPIARVHYYVTATVGSIGSDPTDVGPRFVTSEHWRLYQLFPDEMSHATQHFTDLVARQLVLANAEGRLASSDPQRDAWLITKLVMAVFHHYAFAPADDSNVIGEELWEFCARAIGVPGGT